MSHWSIADVSAKMRNIDFAMLMTRTDGKALAGRPMSNNGDVEFDGDSFFFTDEKTRTVADISADAQVALSYTGAKGMLGAPPVFISIEGEAQLIRDKSAFKHHWTKGLDHWFAQGVETPGIVLIKVVAKRIHYWEGEHEGEIPVH